MTELRDSGEGVVDVVVLLASHNRRETTIACLRALFSAAVAGSARLSVVLVDDGSIDGTADAIRHQFPSVEVVDGSGDLFWAGAMRLGLSTAHPQLLRSEWILLLNDDTLLSLDALTLLLGAARRSNAGAVVGRVVDAESGSGTYGGLRRHSSLRRMTFVPVAPGESVETFNANAVLLRTRALLAQGGLDACFTHGLADIDLGLRLRASGVKIVSTDGPVGTCSRNSTVGTHLDPRLGLSQRWRAVRSVKGIPPREWRHFVKRHAGAPWPFYFVAPYVRVVRPRRIPR